jgi:4-hydroxy-tetrahydrodipicolinate synthase
MLLPHLAAGAVGIVSVCSHLVGPQMKEIFSAWGDGKVEEARRIYLELVPLFDVVMGITSSPIPVKAAAAMLGLEVGDPRLPLVPATDDQKAKIREALERVGLL